MDRILLKLTIAADNNVKQIQAVHNNICFLLGELGYPLTEFAYITYREDTPIFYTPGLTQKSLFFYINVWVFKYAKTHRFRSNFALFSEATSLQEDYAYHLPHF